MGVGGRLKLKNDRDKEPDVLDTAGLVVELCHERVGQIVPDDRGVGHAVTRRAGGGGLGVV